MFSSCFRFNLFLLGKFSDLEPQCLPLLEDQLFGMNPQLIHVRVEDIRIGILQEGKVQMKEVQGPKVQGSLEDRMEALEQEVFRYKKMAEREVDVIHKISSELITKHEGDEF